MGKEKQLEDMSDHDLLIRLNERQDCMSTTQELQYGLLRTHLQHHWAFFIGAVMLLAGVLIQIGQTGAIQG